MPRISRPGSVPVEVTLNGIDYTHDRINFTYYDAFIVDLKPRIVSKGGTTKVHALGFGYADTGD